MIDAKEAHCLVEQWFNAGYIAAIAHSDLPCPHTPGTIPYLWWSRGQLFGRLTLSGQNGEVVSGEGNG